MKKVSFRKLIVDVEDKEQEIWVLETPTLLEELFQENILSKEEYETRLNVYNQAIKIKETPTEAKGRLRDYQEQTINYAKEFNSFAIFSEPRLGKTPTTIGILKEKNLINERIVVLSPSTVIGNWIKAFKEWGDTKATKYDGTIESNVLVMTYKRAALSLKELIKWKPTVVILDEAHVLRNSRGKRQQHKYTEKQKEEKLKVDKLIKLRKIGRELTEEQKEIIKSYQPPISENKAILTISSKAEHRYALSGTPNVNKPEDIFAILQFVFPQFFKSYWSFVYYYFDVKISHFGGREIKKIINEQKEKELQEMLDYISTRDTQRNQMKWLKPPKVEYTYLPMSKEQERLEYELINEGRLGDNFILNTLEQMTHYNTICLSPKISKVIENNDLGEKAEYILDYIMEHPKENIAIFSTRNEFLNMMKKEIKKEFPNKKIYQLDKNNSSEIQSIINKKSIKYDIIFLGTIGKSKEGISLVGINKGFIADQSWVPSDIEQIMHRLDATTEEQQDFFGEKSFEILQFRNSIDTIVQEGLDEKESKTKIINNYKEFIMKRRNE